MDLLSKIKNSVTSRKKKHLEEEKLREETERLGTLLFEGWDLFPGSLEEYKGLKGAEYEIVDTGKNKKEITIRRFYFADYYTNQELLLRLVEEGCCGLIRFREYSESYQTTYLGLPVRKTKKIESTKNE
jgi:hypothetical protein